LFTPANTAFLLSAGLMLFGGATAWFQVRARRRLKARLLVPSDEAIYFGKRYRLRLVNGVLIATIGAMIGAAYVSGLERQAAALGEHKPDAAADAPDEKPKMTDDQKVFVRFWAFYWVVVMVLVFVVLLLAFRDAWATRRYALSQFAHIREEHEQKLRRDLAVYRQHKANASDGGNRVSGHLPEDR